MKNIILVITIFLGSLSYSQGAFKKKVDKPKNKKSHSNEDTLKKINSASQMDLVLSKLDSLKREIDLISSRLSPSESVQPYKDSIVKLKDENSTQKRSIESLNSDLKSKTDELTKLSEVKQRSEKQTEQSYLSLANNLIKYGSVVPKEVLDSISKHLTKSNVDFETFKIQSENLKFAQDLLSKSSITVEEYNKLKNIMTNSIGSKFPEQNKNYERLKNEFNDFNKYGKLLNNLLIENSAITDLKYRKNLIDFDFPSKEACLTIPYLAKKLNEAYNNPKTKIDLVFP
jgi:hypothetical protein